MFILLQFCLFYEIKTELFVDSFCYPFRKPESLKKMYSTGKLKKSHHHSQFYSLLLYFQWLAHLKKAYTMMTCKFLLRYKVLQIVIYQYNYSPQKNSGLQDLNKINTLRENNQIGKPGINGIFITKLNFCLLFNFYLFLYSSSDYVPVTLLTYKRCWHVKINILSFLIYLIMLIMF